MKFTKIETGSLVAELDEPYRLIGDFLTIETYRLDSWPLTTLLPAIEKHRNFLGSGDAFYHPFGIIYVMGIVRGLQFSLQINCSSP